MRSGRCRTRLQLPGPGPPDPGATSPTPLTTRMTRCGAGKPPATRPATSAAPGPGVRRRRAAAGRADRHRPGARRGGRTGVRQRGRARRPRAVAAALRQRRAAPPLHPVDPLRRGDLVPGLQRARGRLGPRVAAHARDRGRRPLRAQRLQDLGLVGPVRALVRRARAHGDGRPQAQGHLDADRRHAVRRASTCAR